MNNTTDSIKLADFDDFRAFLSKIIEKEAASRSGLSLAKFAKAFGLTRSGLSMILNGTRNATLPCIHRMALALRLDPTDHLYFEAMVLKCQAETPELRLYYERKLDYERKSRPTQKVTSASRTLVAEWYVPALLVFLIDVSDDPARLGDVATKLGVSEGHLQEVIESLRAEGFLDFKGGSNVHISFNRVAAMISSLQYMKAAFLESMKQLEQNFNSPEHFFSVHSFSVNARDIRSFIEEYKALVDKYLSTNPSPENGEEPKIVQLSTQFFSVL